MTKVSLRHTVNHIDLLGLFRSSHRKKRVKKVFLKISHEGTCVGVSFLITLQVFRSSGLETPRLMFSCKICENFKNNIFKNICERLLLFVSTQNTITSTNGEFGLDETSTVRKVSVFLNVTILFNQMQSYHLHIS